MKTFVLWGVWLFAPLLVCAQDVVPGAERIVRAGTYETRQLPGGMLPQLIWEGKRSVSVLPEAVFDVPFNKISDEASIAPLIRRAEEITYHYFVQSWKAWRAAANEYLPPKYQLPELSFTLEKDISGGGVIDRGSDSISVILVSRFPATVIEHKGKYTAVFERIELVLPIHLLKYLAFTDTDPLQRALMEGEYRNMICNLAAGPNNYWDNLVLQGGTLDGVRWINRYRPLGKEESACLDEVSALPVKDWVYKGPFAVHNQHVMTHEMGHFLGFGHIDNSIMSTAKMAARTQTKPFGQDGLRLAVSVCYYHNRKAGKEVCVPRVKASKEKKQI